MKLALQFIDHNPHPRCGIFIKHTSPKIWLQEIQRMQLRLQDCIAYVCPNVEANSISGLLIIVKKEQKNIDIGSNSAIQKVDDKFFIPAHTTLNMALTTKEFSKLCNDIPHFFHHEFGLIELTEVLNWATIIQNPQQQFPTIETPLKGVNIPTKVTAFSIEIEEVEEAEALQNPFSSEEVDPKELPFDMKKVLKGNNAEIAKYLNYLDKNPDAALKMAIPLDLLGTSRGKAFAEYKFKNNFFESLGFGDGKGKKYFRILLTVVAIALLFWVGYEALYAVKHNNPDPEIVNPYANTDVTDGTKDKLNPNITDTSNEDIIDVDDGTTQQNQQVTEANTENNILPNILLFVAIVILLLVIWYLIKYQKQTAIKNKGQQGQTWLDLPDESELFDIHQEKAENSATFYFGGDEISIRNKIFIALVLTGLLLYLFYPVLNNDGFPLVFGIVTGIIVLRMLYTLVIRNQIFGEDDTE
ncbi:hypothetical protein [Kordia jejudonensis]|uniref:hypothetical protein n=1 Tax=Kordia jejudonensis TaxID=1348245 RepID=UPI000629312A|nr:hypothetical protein [Kordia jejudonensis]